MRRSGGRGEWHDRNCQPCIIRRTTSLNVSLPQDLKDCVEKQTEARYSTTSEYVRELIRDDQKPRPKERLDTLLLEGLDSGERLPATPEFWDGVKREALAKLGKNKKTKK